MEILGSILGVVLIGIGVAGALNVRRTRDQIVQINRTRPPGDRARSVAGVTAWCAVSVAVGLFLLVWAIG
ncbi:hypothetical protein [Patulibacter sp.]|uniref:hypothetical protein n=1 Tax=Patulibacter sp. TaxID=1912859 RepID=UPI00271EB405|nr:hypothetical protein [Patulibacter sp.]MDO9409375.1 hypothetical protein [Patulibacter sp.]